MTSAPPAWQLFIIGLAKFKLLNEPFTGRNQQLALPAERTDRIATDKSIIEWSKQQQQQHTIAC